MAADTKKVPSDMVTIKNYFGLTAQQAMAEVKKLTPTDKAQLADGIRDTSENY